VRQSRTRDSKLNRLRSSVHVCSPRNLAPAASDANSPWSYVLVDEIREQLLTLSPATADRGTFHFGYSSSLLKVPGTKRYLSRNPESAISPQPINGAGVGFEPTTRDLMSN